jgi:DNA replication protein DnaC
MSAATIPVQQATIRQYAKRLQLAAIAGQFAGVAEQAIKAKQSHLSYLEVLLGMEVEERERNTVARRIKEAHFPKVKTLEEFAFCDAPHIPVAVVRNLAEGGYLQRSEPIIFLGETGTLGYRTGGGRVPAEEASAFHHRGRDGERTDRSQEQQ